MQSRRGFLTSGMGAFALGVLGRRALGDPPPSPPCANTGGVGLGETAPFRHIPLHPTSVNVNGMPFAPWFSGDDFSNESIPFHTPLPTSLPPPEGEVGVAIVGGGISGLTTAYLLRRHRPVVLELHDRFGGGAQGEVWGQTSYSLGGAYVITPDPGCFLNSFYRQLGLHRVKRVSNPPDPMELNGEILEHFWSGVGLPPGQAAAFARYAEVVSRMAYERYPDIPLPTDPQQRAWILSMDQVSFREDIEEQMGLPIPPLLAAGIQSYCYSSFGAGWEEISAASGWNFVAAERSSGAGCFRAAMPISSMPCGGSYSP